MDKYSEKLLGYFHHTTFQGRLDSDASNVFMAKVGGVQNQEVLQLFLQMDGSNVVDARFLAMGSVAIIGGAQWLCGFVIGKSKEQLSKLTVADVLQALELTAVRVHIAQLLLAALVQCLQADNDA